MQQADTKHAVKDVGRNSQITAHRNGIIKTGNLSSLENQELNCQKRDIGKIRNHKNNARHKMNWELTHEVEQMAMTSTDVCWDIEDKIDWADRRIRNLDNHKWQDLRGKPRQRIKDLYLGEVRKINHLRDLFDVAVEHYCEHCGSPKTDTRHETINDVCLWDGIDCPF